MGPGNNIRSLIYGVSLQVVAVTASANLISNGGFEDPTFAGPPPAYQFRTGSELTGWIVTSDYRGVVQFNNDYRPVDQGTYSVQIESGAQNSLPGDSISQSFATTAGSFYRLTFDLSAYDAGGALLRVMAGNLDTTLTGSSSSWALESFGFTALTASTTLTFQNVGAWGVSYPHLDNVSVTVPDGGLTVALLGSALVGVEGLRRKLRKYTNKEKQ